MKGLEEGGFPGLAQELVESLQVRLPRSGPLMDELSEEADGHGPEFQDPLALEIQATPGPGHGGEVLGADLGWVAEITLGEARVDGLVATCGDANPVGVQVEGCREPDGFGRHGVPDAFVFDHARGPDDDLKPVGPTTTSKRRP